MQQKYDKEYSKAYEITEQRNLQEKIIIPLQNQDKKKTVHHLRIVHTVHTLTQTQTGSCSLNKVTLSRSVTSFLCTLTPVLWPPPHTSREGKQKHRERKRRKEWEINSRRDTFGDLRAFVSSTNPLISSSGPRVAPCVTEQGVGVIIYHCAPASVFYCNYMANRYRKGGHFSHVQTHMVWNAHTRIHKLTRCFGAHTHTHTHTHKGQSSTRSAVLCLQGRWPPHSHTLTSQTCGN